VPYEFKPRRPAPDMGVHVCLTPGAADWAAYGVSGGAGEYGPGPQPPFLEPTVRCIYDSRGM